MALLRSIRGKLMACFLVIAAITAIVSFISYSGMRNLERKFDVVLESAPLIETAMNMKLVLNQDLMKVMKIMAALDTEELDAVWKDHEINVRQFNSLKSAILEGGQVNGKTVFPARDEGLRQIILASSSAYVSEVLPNFKTAYEQMYRQLSAEPYDYDLLDTIDETTMGKGLALSAQLDRAVEISQSLISDAEDQVRRQRSETVSLIWSATVAGVAAAIVLGFLLANKIAGPIKKADKFIQEVAGGDFTLSLETLGRDEIGSMVKAMNAMVKELAEAFRKMSSGVVTLNQTSGDLSEVSGSLDSGMAKMSERSKAVSKKAQTMSDRIASLAAGSEQSSANLDRVSAAMEEMNATVTQIVKNTEAAKSVARSAVTTAVSASSKVDELGSDAREIGQVTEMITDISGQTNLLALNATIEASRAGEAGKGFAVVASEIKALADQTAEAAKSIASRIESIQDSTTATLEEIGTVSGVINKVDAIVQSIATAMEEQALTSKEISENIAQALRGIRDIHSDITSFSTASSGVADDISNVHATAGNVRASTREVNESVDRIAAFAGQLQDILARFKV